MGGGILKGGETLVLDKHIARPGSIGSERDRNMT